MTGRIKTKVSHLDMKHTQLIININQGFKLAVVYTKNADGLPKTLLCGGPVSRKNAGSNSARLPNVSTTQKHQFFAWLLY